MGVVWMEGFELCGDVAGLAAKYHQTSNVLMGGGRTGGSGLVIQDGGSFASEPLAPRKTMTLGCGVLLSGLTGTAAFLDFRRGAAAQFSVGVHSSGVLTYVSDADGTVLGAINPWAADQWNYLEVKFTLGDGDGSLAVRMNGSTVVNVTGRHLFNPAAADLTVDSVAWYCSGFTMGLDDVYLCDTLGPDNYDFMGSCQIQGLLPVGDGSEGGWATSGGGPSHYTLVNDAVPDGDSGYVSTSTTGATDTYAFPDPTPLGAGVGSVSVEYLARGDAPGASLAAVVRRSGVDHFGPAVALGASYRYDWQCFDQDPATNRLWTTAGLDSAEFGFKRV